MKKNIKKIKILVADDSMFMRKYISGILESCGFTNIIEASNGSSAIDTYFSEEPDIVLLDIIMPVKTGMDALKEIVSKKGKVIIVSAVGQKSVIEKAIKAGAKDFIIKPFFNEKDLLEKIKKAIG